MKVCLDTNVLIAAFIARGSCHDVFATVVRQHTLIASAYIVNEFKEKLVEKFDATQREARQAVALIEHNAQRVTPVKVSLQVAIDRDDLPVLGTAIAGDCACLVTGDKELLALKTIQDIPILSPRDFWSFETGKLRVVR